MYLSADGVSEEEAVHEFASPNDLYGLLIAAPRITSLAAYSLCYQVCNDTRAVYGDG